MKWLTKKPSPTTGKVAALAVERGKREQKRKNDSNLCTQACPYRLAWLGTSLRIRGKRTTKEERNYSFKIYYLIIVIKR